MDTCPNVILVPSLIITSPIWVPGIAILGAYHGIKAAVIHGIIPGAKRLAGASRKK